MTDKQKEILQAYIECGNSSYLAAKKVNVADRYVRHVIHNLRSQYGQDIANPENQSDKIGHVSGKVTSQLKLNKDGEFVEIQKWVREYPEQDFEKHFVDSLIRLIPAKPPKINKEKKVKTNKCAVFAIGDPHIGLLIWDKQDGENYDTDKAVEIHKEVFSDLLSRIDFVDEIIIAPLGDVVESDNRYKITDKSKNTLDADFYFKAVDATAKMLTFMIESASQKANSIRVYIPPGNHDWHSAQHISRYLAAYYKDWKNVFIDTEPTKQKFYRCGVNYFCFAHTDTEKADVLASYMIQRNGGIDYASSIFRMVFGGHTHNEMVIYKHGVRFERFNTLSPRNAWAAEMGFLSPREMHVLYFNKEKGQIGRDIRMVTKI